MRSEGHGTFPERLMVDCSRCSCICTTVGSVYRDFKLKYIGRILETKKGIWSGTCSCLSVYCNVGDGLSPEC